jgi:hypothetical protein
MTMMMRLLFAPGNLLFHAKKEIRREIKATCAVATRLQGEDGVICCDVDESTTFNDLKNHPNFSF